VPRSDLWLFSKSRMGREAKRSWVAARAMRPGHAPHWFQNAPLRWVRDLRILHISDGGPSTESGPLREIRCRGAGNHLTHLAGRATKSVSSRLRARLFNSLALRSPGWQTTTMRFRRFPVAKSLAQAGAAPGSVVPACDDLLTQVLGRWKKCL
jgi:hypothetical protein